MSYECWKAADIPGPDSERLEGYMDGYKGEPEPGGNRSPAYVHGWWCGNSDRTKVSQPWQRALAADVLAEMRKARTP